MQQTLADVQAAVNAVREAAEGLFEFHAALVELRGRLEPLRDRLLHLEDELSALYWSRAAAGRPGRRRSARAPPRAHTYIGSPIS